MNNSIPKMLGTRGAVDYKTEILSGLTVAVALVPEAIAFAMIAGFSPLTGLYAAFVMVTVITVVTHNLAVAVLIGIIFSALVFSWENAKRIRARKSVDEMGIKHYEIYGPLFFGSVKAFADKFDPLSDPAEVIIDFKESRITDMSAIEAVNNVTHRYRKQGKTIHLRHLSDDCKLLLRNADAIIDVNVLEDPTYKIPVNDVTKVKR